MTLSRVIVSTMLIGSSLVLVGTTGCTSQEETETVATLQTALSDLTQNRALTEQFVRDVKASVSPTDPNYQQAMDSYEDARDAYNRYLDTVESGQKSQTSRSLRSSEALGNARSATAEFLADATAALKPSVNTRRVPFQRAVSIPDNLQHTLRKLPKHAREVLVDQFDSQVRWRSWGQL